ncbi:MAG: dihydropyrimidinase, partial [Oligoflexia bacterium]|nr:dihydropyrimidinase [Oligoflexia bacterium]
PTSSSPTSPYPPYADIADTDTIDASNCIVLPGGIDAHTHFELPQMDTISSDSFETGSAAALFGGTTTIIDFASGPPGTRDTSLVDIARAALARANGRSYCDYGFHLIINQVPPMAKLMPMLRTIIEEYGITSFKTFLAYDNLLISQDELLRLIEACKQYEHYGALVTIHAEDGASIKALIAQHQQNINSNTQIKYHPLCHPPKSESDATKLALQLASTVSAPIYFVHVSCQEALEALSAIKKCGVSGVSGVKCWVESCPQYLFLDESLYNLPPAEAAKYVMCPPLRGTKDIEYLWRALLNGEIDVIASDHCPFMLHQKLKETNFSKIPSGAPGVENRVPLLFSAGVMQRGMSLNSFAKVIATNPAKIFNLYPQKGVIREGSDADLIIIDPRPTQTISHTSHHMHVDYSAYEGMQVRGNILYTILRGKIAVDKTTLKINCGTGKFLPRNLKIGKNVL